MKLASIDTYDTNSTSHGKVENDQDRKVKENTRSDGNIIKTPTNSKCLDNTKPRAGAIGSKIKFLWSPDSKKTMCLVRGTVCKKLNSSNTSWKETRSGNMAIVKELIVLHHWGEEHLKELPESLTVDSRQNEIWVSGGIVWENIDIIEAWDIANNFETPRVNSLDDEVVTETAIINQECEEPVMTELEIWFNSQDFRTEFDKVEDAIYNDDILLEIVLNIKILPQGKGLQSPFESDQESDKKNTEPKKNITSRHDNSEEKELDGIINLMIGKREDGKVDVLNAYLNGVERRVFVDSGAAVSIIHNIQEPRKNRIFKVINVQRNYLSNWHKWSEIYWSDDEYDDNSANKNIKT